MKTMFSRAALIALLASVVAIAGCKGKDGGAAPDTTVAAAMPKPDTRSGECWRRRSPTRTSRGSSTR